MEKERSRRKKKKEMGVKIKRTFFRKQIT